MTKKGCTKIVNFMTPGAGVLMLGYGHLSHYSEYAVFSTLSIYSTLVACVPCVKGLWCCFPIPSLIFNYSMMGLLIYKYEPLWQEVSVKSLILRWPLRPVGLLFYQLHFRSWFFFIVNRQIFESCDHSVQCNGTENATLCKDHGIKRLCYCDHGYLEVGGVCLLGHNEYNYGFF